MKNLFAGRNHESLRLLRIMAHRPHETRISRHHFSSTISWRLHRYARVSPRRYLLDWNRYKFRANRYMKRTRMPNSMINEFTACSSFLSRPVLLTPALCDKFPVLFFNRAATEFPPPTPSWDNARPKTSAGTPKVILKRMHARDAEYTARMAGVATPMRCGIPLFCSIHIN